LSALVDERITAALINWALIVVNVVGCLTIHEARKREGKFDRYVRQKKRIRSRR
jgi:hypothetical protein